jgi:hypothetical protein
VAEKMTKKKQLYARWWATVDDKIVEMPPVKIHLFKDGKPPKGKKPRKSE